ncbi:MAG: PQQ-binding-like beta-propeller repeat protein [Acidobacteriota bacterium]
MRFERLTRAFAGVLLFAAAAGQGAAEDWPAFRGADGDGLSNERGVIPADGGVALEVRWRRPLGSGYSGVAVAGAHVVTQAVDGEGDVLVALDAADGELRWRVRLGPTYPGHDGSHDGPLATPAVGDGAVVGLGARGELVAVELETGALRWRRDLPTDSKARKPHYGFSTSPRVVDGQAIVALGGYRRAVASFDLDTGDVRWVGGSDLIDYQSPMLWRRGDGVRLLAAGNGRLMSLDPSTGEEQWHYLHEGGGTRGSYSLTPVPAGENRLFLAHRDEGSALVRLDAETGAPFEVVWEGRTIRNSYASAIFLGGHLYAYSSRFLTAVDAATGEARWRSRRAGDGFLIGVDGHLVIQAKDGRLRVVRASPVEYDERASIALFDDVSWNTPSFSDGAVYSRSLSEIARVEVGSRPSEARVSATSWSPVWKRLLASVEGSPEPGQVIDAFLAARPGGPFFEDGAVHLVFRGAARDVVVAGDVVGARRELPLQRLGETDLFFRTLDLPQDAVVSYLFFVDFEARLDPRNPRTAVNTVFGDDLEPVLAAEREMSVLSVRDASALGVPAPASPGADGGSAADLRPPTAGSLDSLSFESRRLGRRVDTTVYRPAGVGAGRELPTVYWLGGRDALRWGAAAASLDRLLAGGLPAVQVVFVLESGAGVLGPLEGMLVDELVPLVESRGGVVARRDQRALVGMGWDALAAARIGLKRGDVFGFVALQSVYALTAPEGGLEAWARPASDPPRVYLDWGAYDLRNTHEAWSTVEDNRRFDRALRDAGVTVVGGEVAAGSSWASWSLRTDLWLEDFLRQSR